MARPTLKTTSRILARFLRLDADTLTEHFYPADESHLPQILDIRKPLLPESARDDDESYLRWRYRWGPAPSGQERWRENRIWVFVVNNEVLGLIGVESVTLRLKGTTVPCLKLMDLAVAEKMDRKGLGVWMNLVLLGSGMATVTLGSNKNSLGLISKLFCRVRDRNVYKSVLRSKQYFIARFGDNVAGHMLATCYDVAMGLSLNWNARKSARELQLRSFDHFGNEQSKVIHNFAPAQTYVVRTQEYLNWRLCDIPNDAIQLLGIHNREELVGWLAISRRDQTRGREAFIQDWGFLPGCERQFSEALFLLKRNLFQQGYNSLAALAYDGHSDSLLRRAGIRRRRDNSKTFAVYSTDPDTMSALSDADAWFVTGSDSDDF